MSFKSLTQLNQVAVDCRLCKRLVEYRESVTPKSKYKNEEYWKRPVLGFGDPKAHLFILGLAPSAQGGNRTGRIFTGDASGDFLFQVLHQAGYANQSTSTARNDGLELIGCYITAAVKCAPPQNKPTPKECMSCSQYWTQELHLLKNVTAVLCLGKFAFDAFYTYANGKTKREDKRPLFKHGGIYALDGLPTLHASYHPSPQNTNTGKFTQKMFIEVLENIRHLKAPPRV